jgi:hypothetical protein
VGLIKVKVDAIAPLEQIRVRAAAPSPADRGPQRGMVARAAG